MGILFRYACLLGIGAASIFMFLSASTVTGQMLASTSGYALQNPGDLPYFVLAAVAVFGFASMMRFVFSGFPQLVREWRDRRRRNNYTVVAMICLLGAVFIIV
ncbi:MAG: hypothetical protein MPJ78_14265 [Hyphomicrobiaceae bacterium]|nr:hypothetical protein [Hyphomicrobiaceae bacterium]